MKVDDLVKAICHKEGLHFQEVKPLSGGQINSVFQIDDRFVIRIGARDGAFERLKCETEIIHSISNEAPVPRIVAFGLQDGSVYQIQQFVHGQKLHHVWNSLPPAAQDKVAAELASYLRIFHRKRFSDFGPP